MNENVSISIQEAFQQDYQSVFTLLYCPLIGKDAYFLYQLLISLSKQSYSLEELMDLCNMKPGQFERARESLEEFSLLKTYLNAQNNQWKFLVNPPLNAHDFLIHDSYARLFIHICGSKKYDFMKYYFQVDPEKLDGFIDVSKQFDTSRFDLWNEKKEDVFQKNKPEDKRVYDFDFQVFFQGMDRIFPIRLRNEENLNLIAQLSSIYGIDEKEMKRLVQRSVHPVTKELDQKVLKDLVFSSRKAQKPKEDPYTMAPVQFLRSKQKGLPVSASDKRLIESLCVEYGFSNEVVNVLIEYCLEKTNQSLSKNYVEKVAANWARLHIDSKEQALKQIQPKQKNPKPDWYLQTTQNKPTKQALEEALRLQEKLKGSDES